MLYISHLLSLDIFRKKQRHALINPMQSLRIIDAHQSPELGADTSFEDVRQGAKSHLNRLRLVLGLSSDLWPPSWARFGPQASVEGVLRGARIRVLGVELRSKGH
jgi:hypothetical protein